MKPRHLLLLFATVVSLHAASDPAYSVRARFAIEQVRALHDPAMPPEIGGEAVGYAGAPHETFLLFRYIRAAATNDDIERMLTDADPVVRSLGALCALYDPWRKIDPQIVDGLLQDRTPIVVGAFGCVFTGTTVGELVGRLKTNPKLFDAPGAQASP